MTLLHTSLSAQVLEIFLTPLSVFKMSQILSSNFWGWHCGTAGKGIAGVASIPSGCWFESLCFTLGPALC